MRQIRLLGMLLLCALLGLPFAGPGRPAQAQATATVYLLRGGDTASDTAVRSALEARGLNVTVGPLTIEFNGSQANLQQYDALVMLFNQSWQSSIPADGVRAIRNYVEKGGGLVTSEWPVSSDSFSDLMPATSCGWSSLSTATYRRVALNPILNSNLPDSFSFSLGSFVGSESCLLARPGATVYYSSENGSATQRGGLVGWNVAKGRVLAFSTLLSATELQNTQFATLLQNSVEFVATSRDLTTPTVKSVDILGAASLVNARETTLAIVAEDAGGSRVNAIFVVEYAFSGIANAPWNVVANSGWLSYKPPRLTLPWTMGTAPGVHYFQVFAADGAGNVSPEPVLAMLSYQSGTTTIGQNELRIYRIRPGAGKTVTVTMNAGSGNPDLYVFGPGVRFTPETDNPTEQLSFTAQEGLYQIEVEGFQAGSYSLTVNPGNTANGAAPESRPSLDRPRISVITLQAEEPPPESAPLTEAPVNPEPAGLDQKIYLPLLRGQ